MLSIVFYVPDEALEKVKAAMFAAGAGRLGHYDQCCWQTIGQGQFRPLPGSNPAIGSLGKLAIVDEWKVEMICATEALEKVISAMKAAHPYETPAFLVTKTLPA